MMNSFRLCEIFCYNRTVMRFVSLVLAVLLFSATLVESLHFHDDGADHSDCPVCVAALHHSAHTAQAPLVLLALPEPSPTQFPEFILKTAAVRSCYAPGNRAPPN
jgi:hypothetical protein